MGWGQTLTIILSVSGILLAGGVYIHSDIKSMCSRMDSLSSEHSSRMDAQSARTDQLYQMFVDLLKENKGGK